MTDKTRSPGAWAHDRRQDDWAITPEDFSKATSAPPKIRIDETRANPTDGRAILTSGSKQFRLNRVEGFFRGRLGLCGSEVVVNTIRVGVVGCGLFCYA